MLCTTCLGRACVQKIIDPIEAASSHRKRMLQQLCAARTMARYRSSPGFDLPNPAGFLTSSPTRKRARAKETACLGVTWEGRWRERDGWPVPASRSGCSAILADTPEISGICWPTAVFAYYHCGIIAVYVPAGGGSTPTLLGLCRGEHNDDS